MNTSQFMAFWAKGNISFRLAFVMAVFKIMSRWLNLANFGIVHSRCLYRPGRRRNSSCRSSGKSSDTKSWFTPASCSCRETSSFSSVPLVTNIKQGTSLDCLIALATSTISLRRSGSPPEICTTGGFRSLLNLA